MGQKQRELEGERVERRNDGREARIGGGESRGGAMVDG